MDKPGPMLPMPESCLGTNSEQERLKFQKQSPPQPQPLGT